MGALRTYVYKVIKSSWGVRVSLTAQAVPFVEKTANAVKISDTIWLKQGIDGKVLSTPEMEEAAKALHMLADKIAEQLKGEEVVVIIKDLSYAESDFRIEGIRAAMIGWIAEEFHIVSGEITAHFDRASNCYTFDWQ